MSKPVILLRILSGLFWAVAAVGAALLFWNVVSESDRRQLLLADLGFWLFLVGVAAASACSLFARSKRCKDE